MQKQISAQFFISDDKALLNVELIHQHLTQSYWAKNIPLLIVEKSIEGSYCVGLYHKEAQIGFARLVTDYATFAYLADVFVVEEYRGKGLAKEILQFIMALDWVKSLRNIMLATHDAHELYKPYGFTTLTHPTRYMYKFNLKVYEK
jgi:GNAT superfamily N-acetyltransferase